MPRCGDFASISKRRSVATGRSDLDGHEGHETAIYIADGEVEVWHGPGLTLRTVLRAGDFLYVPPGTPHLPVNRSASPMVAVVARTDPAEQESVHVLELPPHLSELHQMAVAAHG